MLPFSRGPLRDYSAYRAPAKVKEIVTLRTEWQEEAYTRISGPRPYKPCRRQQETPSPAPKGVQLLEGALDAKVCLGQHDIQSLWDRTIRQNTNVNVK